MTLYCITHEIPEIRSCTFRGQHIEGLPDPHAGWRYDPELEIEVLTDQECTGCDPCPARYGLLCKSCWLKLQDALGMALDMITHLRSVAKAQQKDRNDRVKTSSGWVIPVPQSWRIADELIMLLGHPAPGFPSDATVWEVDAITERFLDGIGDPERWVSAPAGAEAAVRFVRMVQDALALHPLEEYAHRVHNVRCHQCGNYSLLWQPPLEFEGAVQILCTLPGCGAEMDITTYERFLQVGAARRRA